LIPEANGFMILSRDDYSMTPCGMTFNTLIGTCGGQPSPGMMGHGKLYILSKKFVLAEGGIKRVVWMSRNLKEQMAEELKKVCEREGVPDLLDNIADSSNATDMDELLQFLESKKHPALTMPPLL